MSSVYIVIPVIIVVDSFIATILFWVVPEIDELLDFFTDLIDPWGIPGMKSFRLIHRKETFAGVLSFVYALFYFALLQVVCFPLFTLSVMHNERGDCD